MSFYMIIIRPNIAEDKCRVKLMELTYDTKREAVTPSLLVLRYSVVHSGIAEGTRYEQN